MAFSDINGKVAGIIPARYASTRFPGKPLVKIGGVSMIERVYNQVKACPEIDTIVVATDDILIYDHVTGFGGLAVMTSEMHRSGTDRIGETLGLLEKKEQHFDIAVNIQGDEPFIKPEQISKVLQLFNNSDVNIATLIKRISQPADLSNQNVVKVLTDAAGRAMMFSRLPIPCLRGHKQDEWLAFADYFKHIGIYAYRTAILKKLVQLEPAPPEIAESLEQLRWMWNGFTIYTEITEFETIGIDTPDDLLKLTNIS